MKTILVQIGNSDDKLAQREWADFFHRVDEAMSATCERLHFAGCADPAGPRQNAAWVGEIDPVRVRELRQTLRSLAGTFRQDSIALTLGETEFVRAE